MNAVRAVARVGAAPAPSPVMQALGLSALPVENGVSILSPPQSFEGGEDAYEARIGVRHEGELRSGRGAWRLAQWMARRPLQRVLEIGAGGGTCTVGLVDAAPDAQVLVTDTSPVFLDMIRRRLGADCGPNVAFATLAGEDMARLPQDAFDAIVVASAVHHVTDWRAFLAQAAQRLRPGGVFVMQEPFREGYLLMALALDFVLSDAWPQAHRLDRADAAKVAGCRDSIYFLADSAADKHGEDKHNFLVDDVVSAAAAAGFSASAFFVNRHFDDLPEDLSTARAGCSLTGYLRAFLHFHHRVSNAGLDRIFEPLTPLMARMEATYLRADGPAILACVALRR